VLSKEEGMAREQIAQWTQRTRAAKIEMFGAEAIDARRSALQAPGSAAERS
jgi:hypothetical protein